VSNWSTKAIGELVAQAKTGATPPTSHPEFFEGEVNWFTPGDIGNSKQLVRASRRISSTAISEGKAPLFPKGALLVTCIGQVGRVGILDQDSSSNQQITALTFASEIDVNFAYYWFSANRKELEIRANQAVVPILNNERLFEIELSHPGNIGEQRRIASQLDQADLLRRTRRYALELTDTVLPPAFLKLFGKSNPEASSWPSDKLVELCEREDDIRCGPFGTQLNKTAFRSSGVPLWGIKHVNTGFALKTHEFLTETKAEERKDKVPPPRVVVPGPADPSAPETGEPSPPATPAPTQF